MKKYSYLAGAAFLAIASSTSLASITLVATPTTSINPTLLADGWIGYTLTLVASGASTGVDAVDFHNVVTAQPGMPQSNIGISGDIHQSWIINNVSGGGADVSTPLASSTNQGNLTQTRDSFWVTGGNGFVSETNAPTEDNNKANGGSASNHNASPLNDVAGTTGSSPTNGFDFGVGSLMTFSGAYNTPFTSSVILGFIIVPSSVNTTINGVAVDQAITDFAISTVLGVTTPEPASVGLVGLGALAMLARRRRKV